MNSLYPSLSTCRKIAHLFPETEMVIDEDGSIYIRERFSNAEIPPCVSCPNLAELLERLPETKITKKRDHCDEYYYEVVCTECFNETMIAIDNESLPEALGLLLHKLDKEGLV